MNPLYSPKEIHLKVADNLRGQRLGRNLSQEELSHKSGVPLSTLRIFEQKGQISLANLVKIAIALGEEESLLRFLEPPDIQTLLGKMKKPQSRIRATGSRKVNRV